MQTQEIKMTVPKPDGLFDETGKQSKVQKSRPETSQQRWYTSRGKQCHIFEGLKVQRDQ